MNISVSGGVVVNSKERVVIINGKVIPFHEKMSGRNITTINNKTYIDGFEWKNGEWKKTTKAWFHKFF